MARKYDMGDPDFFGLDDFGMPVGLNPMWGAVIGGAVSTGAAIGARMTKNSTAAKYSEALGTAAGLAAGGLMAVFKGSRAAGWAAILTAAATSGLRALEQAMGGGEMHGVEIDRIPSLQGAQGIGLTTMQQVPTLQGAGMGDLRPPMELLSGAANGFAGNVAAAHVPADVRLNGLAGRFGATILGGNN